MVARNALTPWGMLSRLLSYLFDESAPIRMSFMLVWWLTALIWGIILSIIGAPPQGVSWHSPFMLFFYFAPTYWVAPGIVWGYQNGLHFFFEWLVRGLW